MRTMAKLLLLLALSVSAIAQTTLVVGTITDANNVPYSNGTIQIAYNSASANTFVAGLATKIPTQTWTLTNSGALPSNVSVYDVNYITPKDGYNVTVCASDGVTCKTIPLIPIQQARMDISAQYFIPSVMPLLSGPNSGSQILIVPILSSPPAAPATGKMALYGDALSGQVLCTFSGGDCTPSGGSGSVQPSPQYQIPYYNLNGSASSVTGTSGVTVDQATQSVLTASGGIQTGSGLITACQQAIGGCIALGEVGSGGFGVPTAGVDIFQASTAHVIMQNINGAGTWVPVPNSATLPLVLSSVGVLSINNATSSTFGAVKPDNTTITISSGVITAVGGSPAFSAVTAGTNTTAAMVCGTGCSMSVTGAGTIAATSVPAAGLGAGTITNNTSGTAAGLSSPLALSGLATQAADTIVINATGSTAVPTAVTLPSCANDGAHALTYPSHVPTCSSITGSAPAFNTVTTGTNTTALHIGSGGTLDATGTGTITATGLPLSGLTAPAANTSIATAAFGITLTGNAATGSTNILKVTDTGSNTGNGIMLWASSASGSGMTPFQADVNGKGVKLNTSGQLIGVGQTASTSIVWNSITSGGTSNVTVGDSSVGGVMTILGGTYDFVGDAISNTWSSGVQSMISATSFQPPQKDCTTLPDGSLCFNTANHYITFNQNGTTLRTVATQAGVETLANKTLISPNIAVIQDANGNPFIQATGTASAVDGFTVVNAATANPARVTLGATGSDSNIDAQINSKGTGLVYANGIQVDDVSSTLALQNKTLCDGTTITKCFGVSTSGSSASTKATLTFATTANRSYGFPDIGGNVPIMISQQVPALDADGICALHTDTITGLTCRNAADATVANGVTNFLTLYAVPGNLVASGHKIHVHFVMALWSTATVPTLLITIEWGGTTIWTNTPTALSTGWTGQLVPLDFDITAMAAPGASVASLSSGIMNLPGLAQATEVNKTNQPVNIATNSNQNLTFGIGFSAATAGNAMRLQTMEVTYQ